MFCCCGGRVVLLLLSALMLSVRYYGARKFRIWLIRILCHTGYGNWNYEKPVNLKKSCFQIASCV